MIGYAVKPLSKEQLEALPSGTPLNVNVLRKNGNIKSGYNAILDDIIDGVMYLTLQRYGHPVKRNVADYGVKFLVRPWVNDEIGLDDANKCIKAFEALTKCSWDAYERGEYEYEEGKPFYRVCECIKDDNAS